MDNRQLFTLVRADGMASNEEPKFVSLRQFWEQFSFYTPAASRVLLPPLPSFIHGLNQHFGRLTDHSVSNQTSTSLLLECSNCRNCNSERKTEVCETHIGIIAGSLRRLLDEVVDVSYIPNATGRSCAITIQKIDKGKLST